MSTIPAGSTPETSRSQHHANRQSQAGDPQQQSQPSDNDRTTGELRAADCNLASLCDHIQTEGFNSGSFSDVVVQAMGSTYRLHRLILSRSSYFRNMLHGPWKEAASPTLVLHIDDVNVNSESIGMALAYLYGHHPKLNDSNAFRVLAAASFLDLQDLCAICTDFIISELWTANFLAYQVFAESQDYGLHGERVRSACWGYLCQSGTMELREALPKLSSQTLHALLTSDELWVPNEEKRFELALYTMLAKGAFSEVDHVERESSSSSEVGVATSDSSVLKGKNLIDNCGKQLLESEFLQMGVQYNLEGHIATHNTVVELADCADFQTDVPYSESVQIQQPTCSQPMLDSRYSAKIEQHTNLNLPLDSNTGRSSCFVEFQNGIEVNRIGGSKAAMEGPSGDSSCYQINSNIWLPRDQDCSSSSGVITNDWGRCNMPPLWGGRIVGRREAKTFQHNWGMRGEDYDTFKNIFEGGSLLYCNMSFEALLSVRKQLEEMGFPCKSVNDGLWLQTLLYQRVQAIAADTCKNCCLTSAVCACRQAYGYSSQGGPTGYYRQEHDRSTIPGHLGNVYLADPQGDGNGLFGPTVRVHVRGAIDGLAGIGRGNTYVPGAAWPPTRYVFSRVPFGLGNRNCQQAPANDESEARADINGELSGDGLTALVNLSQGSNAAHLNIEQTGRVYDPDVQGRYSGSSSVPNAGGIPMQMLESQEHALGLGWESSEDSSISLDVNTPLRHFPPFRFGVEFDDVHRLTDGQVKHSPEVFYAGSLWKVSVQAFNDEDPQGRRTLGLFLHRRKAEVIDSLRKVHMYVDTREKVTARYQLICPSKREVMVFGSFKQAGTQLPKAPKGWGWRTALMFDELADLLQGGALRIAAVVQLV